MAESRRLMPRNSADRTREALARLPSASREELRAEWLRLYGRDPPPKLRRPR